MVTLSIIIALAIVFLLLSPKTARKFFHQIRLSSHIRKTAEHGAEKIRRTRSWRKLRVRVRLSIKKIITKIKSCFT